MTTFIRTKLNKRAYKQTLANVFTLTYTNLFKLDCGDALNVMKLSRLKNYVEILNIHFMRILELLCFYILPKCFKNHQSNQGLTYLN